MVRWVRNKDEHADNLSEIATYYFMVQRVTSTEPPSPEQGSWLRRLNKNDAGKYEKYVREITLLHQLIYHAMKAKQTTDLEAINKLRDLLKQFQTSYLDK